MIDSSTLSAEVSMNKSVRPKYRGRKNETASQYLFDLEGEQQGRGTRKFRNAEIVQLQPIYKTFEREILACTYEHERRIAKAFTSEGEFDELRKYDVLEFDRRIQSALCPKDIRNRSPQCAHTGCKENLRPNPYETEIIRLHLLRIITDEWKYWQKDMIKTILNVDEIIAKDRWNDNENLEWREELQAPIIIELNQKREILRGCVYKVLVNQNAVPIDTPKVTFVELGTHVVEK